MPSWFDDPSPTPAPAPQKSGSWFDSEPTTATQSSENNEEGYDFGGAAIGGVVLAGLAGLLLKNPGIAGKLYRGANAVRMQSMLSGLAVPKSALGNVGAVMNTAMETKSTAPLKAFFSRQTLDDAVGAYRNGRSAGPTPGVTLPGPNPGKIMGAMDEATQNALVRSGQSAESAQRAVLQSPLTGQLGEAFEGEGKVLSHLFPFRRTPFNQFTEGVKTLGPSYAHKGITAGYAGAGAVHGSATADEQYPVTIPLAMALSVKYGLPYAIGAIAARKLSGGQGGGGIGSSALPVSEYGIEQSLGDPLKPFVKPAASRFFE